MINEYKVTDFFSIVCYFCIFYDVMVLLSAVFSAKFGDIGLIDYLCAEIKVRINGM